MVSLLLRVLLTGVLMAAARMAAAYTPLTEETHDAWLPYCGSGNEAETVPI
jgi:hypothetical protein